MVTKNSLTDEIIDAVREDIVFELGNDRDSDLYDVAYESLHSTMENMVIYTSTCKEIIHALDFDIFSDDNQMGEKAESWSHAAYIALMELYVDVEEIIDEVKTKYDKL